MEAGTTPAQGTGSMTIADLCARAAEQFGDQVAIKHKVDGAWRDVTFAQVGEIVAEIGLGLIALGLQPGERVAILCNTRPEWAYADFAISSAGGVVVPIYPTNSPEECEWVAGNSESVFVVCEDAEQVAKIVAVRDRLPALRKIIVVDPSGDVADAISLDDVRGRGDRATPTCSPSAPPRSARTIRSPSSTRRGRPGRPRAACSRTATTARCSTWSPSAGCSTSGDDLVYLFLPLAHAFALLIQLGAVDRGTAIAYYGGDTKAIIGELMEVKPTYLPSVPRIFEKFYTLAQQQLTAEELEMVRTVGGEIQDLESAARPVPDELRERFAPVAPKAEFVKGLFGGRMREAVTGAAPIAHEILEFFWGCGIPVMEGYGMTETSTVATSSRPDDHKFGTVGKPLPGVEVKIAEDGELLIRGANIFQGYYRNDDASFGAVDDGLAAHRRPGLGRRRRLRVDHRPQEGHHHHGGRQEPDAGQPGERPQADALGLPGRDARRPPAVPGDAGHARRGGDRAVGRDPGHRGPLDPGARRERPGPRADPGRARRGQHEVRAGRAGQEVRDPRPRPLPGDRRADADPEGQAQRGQRERYVRRLFDDRSRLTQTLNRTLKRDIRHQY